MSEVPARRLKDAVSGLGAADRALLDISLKRGLDDAALARMTGMSEDTIVERRTRIVEHLSSVLGLPAETIRSELSKSAAAVDDASSRANGDGRGAPSGQDAPDSPQRRRWPWLAAGALVIAGVVAAVLVATLGSSGAGRRRAASAGPAASSVSAAPSTTNTASTASPTSTTAPISATTHPGQRLAALAGGSSNATGTVLIAGTAQKLDLHLTVSHLPATSHGHYEVWLYDSIIDSEPLGQLHAGVTSVSLRLPRNARHFRWIDISIQPPGEVFHSGESVVRAGNPLVAKVAGARP